MKKALMIENNYFVNMENIVTFNFENREININTNEPSVICIGITDDCSSGEVFKVPIQEFHRIKRQLCEYMGLDSQEN